MVLCMSGFTFTPYDGYSFSKNDRSEPSVTAYAPEKFILGDTGGQITFDSPTDIFVDEENQLIYISDAGRQSVLVLDDSFRLVSELIELVMLDGSITKLQGPNGLFIKGETLYIADKPAGAIYITDLSGNVKQVLEKPENELFPQSYSFAPTKVLADNLGYTYVLAENIAYGALIYDENGKFSRFFGSNRVTFSAEYAAQAFWRLFMTQQQIANSSRFVPVEYDNFDIDNEGFLYTCTKASLQNQEQIKKLNSEGVDILTPMNYGDKKAVRYKNQTISSLFTDVAVDDNGFIFALDQQRGRVFVFDSESNAISIFGGKSDQVGTFRTPVALDTLGEKVLVLDMEDKSITVFRPTEYGNILYEATVLNLDGRFDEAKPLWEKVILQNANCLVAYLGIGKAYFYDGEYGKAARYFNLAQASYYESTAFAEQRKEFLQKAFPYIAVTLAAGLLTVKFLKKRKEKKSG